MKEPCISCGTYLPKANWVWAEIYLPYHNAPYLKGPICRKCQRKLNILPDENVAAKRQIAIAKKYGHKHLFPPRRVKG